ncbi:hypothetical protein CYLTODRAFT_61618 [Cylindrobasidium torrendii FP15055 ss-10]|uniref:Zn(2)-C6 fungal-type domain-containing protein n=1 Tax=Cylindrobasidium torrendii FP15055 ss-10 TaxID=1314674 RepID=A0A0D7B5G1_9AGAR|nr:hypothetical protein CYLTODRAFT_61618 [Cylindrobasidium torrendii FP15055 ss-10]
MTEARRYTLTSFAMLEPEDPTIDAYSSTITLYQTFEESAQDTTARLHSLNSLANAIPREWHPQARSETRASQESHPRASHTAVIAPSPQPSEPRVESWDLDAQETASPCFECISVFQTCEHRKRDDLEQPCRRCTILGLECDMVWLRRTPDPPITFGTAMETPQSSQTTLQVPREQLDISKNASSPREPLPRPAVSVVLPRRSVLTPRTPSSPAKRRPQNHRQKSVPLSDVSSAHFCTHCH